jgi:glycosyltransferase involved in cell wall biosynthesis
MKIVFLSVWFSDRMGYIENCLPRSLAKLGHDVHIISSTAQVYFWEKNYNTIYAPYLGPNVLTPGTEIIDGVKIHRLPLHHFGKKIYFRKLKGILKKIDPDIVQTFDPCDFPTMQAAWIKSGFRYRLFTANHIVASVFPPLMPAYRNNFLLKFYYLLTRKIPGAYVNRHTSKCFPATIDALEIAVNYCGVDRTKCIIAPLGVDTDHFYPGDCGDSADQKKDLREKLGFTEDEIICIYTGRFTPGKNPLCLAQAIDALCEKGHRVRGLFLGDGPQANEIASMKGCIVHEFVPYHELLPFYHISDIGVWPRQESTSMLDAAACGLPIIVSNRVQATERYEGNGLTYIENDFNDLARVITNLEDSTLRHNLAEQGVKKIRENFGWDLIAKQRVSQYLNALNRGE